MRDYISKYDVIKTLDQPLRELKMSGRTPTKFEEIMLATLKIMQDKIQDLPSAQPEITEDDVKEFCRKRCLIVVTSDFYDEMTRRLPSAQPDIIRCRDCRWRKDQSGSTAWLPCRAIATPSEFYCAGAERRTDD